MGGILTIYTVTNLYLTYNYIVVEYIWIPLKAITTVYQITPGQFSSQTIDWINAKQDEVNLCWGASCCHLFWGAQHEISDREDAVKVAGWTLPHVHQDQSRPRTLSPQVLPEDHSSWGREELPRPGGAHSHAATAGCCIKGHSISIPRTQPLAFWQLEFCRTNRCSSGSDPCLAFPILTAFFLNYLFNSSNSLVYKINISGYTHYVTFYADKSRTTIRCFCFPELNLDLEISFLSYSFKKCSPMCQALFWFWRHRLGITVTTVPTCPPGSLTALDCLSHAFSVCCPVALRVVLSYFGFRFSH